MVTRALLALFAASIVFAGDSGNPLDKANVVLQVRDGNWVDREATRFAASFGGDLKLVRGELARALYRSRSFDGIDLTRPAIFAWRPGNSPLIAVIPINNRAKFLDAFGYEEPGEPPLVRTGERDGTVIYTQNHGGALWEYRLLVANNTAYLAQNNDDCKRLALAVGSPVTDPFAAPVELTFRGDGLENIRLPGREWLTDLPDLPWDAAEIGAVPGLLSGAWRDLACQMSGMTITARTNTQGDLLLQARVVARGDSSLASWIGQQRPGTERLAGQLRTTATAMLVTGRLTFQGQLERWAFDRADLLKAAARSRWTDAADTAYRSLCTLIERTGACAMSIERSGPGVTQNWVAEHPRAVEVGQAAAEVCSALRGAPAQPVRIGETTAFTIGQPGSGSIILAGERHVARIDDRGARNAGSAAGDLLHHLEEPGSLDTTASLATVWADLALAWNAPPGPEGERPEPVILTGLLRPSGSSGLEFNATVPLPRMAQLLGRLAKTPRRD